MTKYTLKGATVGIVLENDNAGVQDKSGTGALSAVAYMGALYDAADLTYFKLPQALDVSFEVKQDVEDIQTLEDEYDHAESIRPTGSGSIEIPMWIDSTLTDITNIIYAVKNHPMGITTEAAGDARHSILEENTASKAVDVSGYAIVLQKRYYLAAGTVRYLRFVFHNVMIDGSPSINPQQMSKYSLEWKNARHEVEITKETDPFTDHADA